MARLLSAEVTGVDRLKRKLTDLPPHMKDAIAAVMVEAAGRVMLQAKAAVPRESGHLASTIRMTRAEPDKRGRLVVRVMAGNDSTKVGSSHQFQLARLVEFGSQGRPAEPFLLSAWRGQRARTRRAIRAAIKRSVREA